MKRLHRPFCPRTPFWPYLWELVSIFFLCSSFRFLRMIMKSPLTGDHGRIVPLMGITKYLCVRFSKCMATILRGSLTPTRIVQVPRLESATKDLVYGLHWILSLCISEKVQLMLRFSVAFLVLLRLLVYLINARLRQ